WYKVVSRTSERSRGISNTFRGDAMSMKRREFLAAGLALSSTAIARAQQGCATPDRAGREGEGRGRAAIPTRVAKTTRMFKSPGLYPNALAVMTDGPGGLWIGQQKGTAQNQVTYRPALA